MTPSPHNLQINHIIIHYCEANETSHNLQINHIIHYCEANDTSQPTNKSYDCEASQPTNKSYHTLL